MSRGQVRLERGRSDVRRVPGGPRVRDSHGRRAVLCGHALRGAVDVVRYVRRGQVRAERRPRFVRRLRGRASLRQRDRRGVRVRKLLARQPVCMYRLPRTPRTPQASTPPKVLSSLSLSFRAQSSARTRRHDSPKRPLQEREREKERDERLGLFSIDGWIDRSSCRRRGTRARPRARRRRRAPALWRFFKILVGLLSLWLRYGVRGFVCVRGSRVCCGKASFIDRVLFELSRSAASRGAF